MALGRNRVSLLIVVLRMAFVILWVYVFVEFMAIDLLKYAKAPGPFGDRGCTPLMVAWG